MTSPQHHEEPIDRTAEPAIRDMARCDDVTVLDHVSIQCADLEASAAFYDAVLATIGGKRILERGHVIGYGVPPMPDF